MNMPLDAGSAVYVAMAVTLSVWIGIFAYLWRIDTQARALRREIEREQRREQPAAPRATVTRRNEGEPVEK
ncbi:MAG: CcmD family protein [Chloroflexales bacterium]